MVLCSTKLTDANPGFVCCFRSKQGCCPGCLSGTDKKESGIVDMGCVVGGGAGLQSPNPVFRDGDDDGDDIQGLSLRFYISTVVRTAQAQRLSLAVDTAVGELDSATK